MFLSNYETYISYSGPCKESSSPYSNINISINESASISPAKIYVREQEINVNNLLSCCNPLNNLKTRNSKSRQK